MTRRLTWIAAIAVAFCSIERRVSAQCSDWVQRTSTFKPASPQYGTMCFDSTRGLSMLYAINADATPDVMESWLWNGSMWAQIRTASFPGGPTGITSSYAMAFDSRRGVVVFFGKNALGTVAETWEFDGHNWELVTTSGPPLTAAGSGPMVFDSNRNVIVLPRWNPSMILWEWDGASWTERTPSVSPPTRYRPGMCFDSVRNVTLLLGGEAASAVYLNDTWEWDGKDWTERFPVHAPAPRREPSMVFDDVRGRVILYGGHPFNQTFNDTWEWDGDDWTEVFPATSPPARPKYADAFDSRRGKLVIFYDGSYPAGAPIEVWEYPAASRPVVRASPKSQVACLGGSATLTAEFFSESPVTLQWRRNESSIPGANSKTLLIDDIDFGDVGTYDLIATNDCGSTATSSATLLVCSGLGGCPSPVDVNGDGVVDGLDIARIVDVLLGY